MICDKIDIYKCKYCGSEYDVKEHELALRHYCCKSCEYAIYDSMGGNMFSDSNCDNCGTSMGMGKTIVNWKLKEALNDRKR